MADGLDNGDWYWFWVTGDDGDRVPAGTFRGTGDTVQVTLSSALPLSTRARIWVTDEDDKVVLDAPVPVSTSSRAPRPSRFGGHAAERARIRVLRQRQAGARVRFRLLVRARARTDAARGPRGHRARPAAHHRRVQGAPARHRHHRRRGHAELQPAEGAAVLVVPVAGARLHRRRVPLVRRLRERSGRVLAHAAVQGQDGAARVALRVLLGAGDARLQELRARSR